MAKEIIVNEEKQTLWSRFTSWLASSWLGKAWKSITGLFSSNKASSKASGTNQPEGETPNNNAQSQDNSKGADQQQEPLAAAFSKETPEVESPATPDNGGGRCFMDNDGDTVIFNSNVKSTAPGPNPTSSTSQTPDNNKRSQVNGQGAGQQQQLQASIRVIGDKGLLLVAEQDKESLVKNSKNPENSTEYLVYIKCDKGTFRITATDLHNTALYNVETAGNNISFSINSVANQDGTNVSGDLMQMKTLLGLDDSKKSIKITEISKDPIVPKAASIWTPEDRQVNRRLSVSEYTENNDQSAGRKRHHSESSKDSPKIQQQLEPLTVEQATSNNQSK